MKDKTVVRIGIILAAAVLLAGCASTRGPLVVKDNPVKTAGADGLRASLRFLDDSALIQKFGKTANPFISDYGSLQRRRITTFELTVENGGAEQLLFIMNRLELQHGGKSLDPYNRFQLQQEWEFQDDQKPVKPIDKVRRERIINENVLPNTLSVPAGGKFKGYVVFIGNTPRYGTATVYVPLLRGKDDLAHRLEFTFEF